MSPSGAVRSDDSLNMQSFTLLFSVNNFLMHREDSFENRKRKIASITSKINFQCKTIFVVLNKSDIWRNFSLNAKIVLLVENFLMNTLCILLNKLSFFLENVFFVYGENIRYAKRVSRCASL